MKTSEPALNEDFRDLLEALIEESVTFLIVGAHALAVHGVARATGDLDVLVEPTAQNASRLVRALHRFGAPVEAHGITASDFEQLGQVYQMGRPPRRIDLLTSITGVSFAEAWRGKVLRAGAGMELPFLGRDELLANKRATGRPKDVADVAMLGGSDDPRR